MIVGIDPGWASLGVVIASQPRGVDDVVFTKVGCMKSAKYKDLTAAQDLTMRADILAHNLAHFVEEGKFPEPDVFAVCVEGMSYPRHTQAAVKLGAANGVVGALVARWEPEVVYVEQPQHIRKRVLDIEKGRTPAEEDVHAHLLERYPELAQLLEGGRKGDRPHILDAAAAVVAAYKEGRLA
jgi:Holliday junction resolvasome RuvABC endonuclease subunit